VILGNGRSDNLRFDGVADALRVPGTQLRLFAKPSIDGQRRLGVALARADSTDNAIAAALSAAAKVKISY
jgi:phosphoribosylglycinamide formyltransferase 2